MGETGSLPLGRDRKLTVAFPEDGPQEQSFTTRRWRDDPRRGDEHSPGRPHVDRPRLLVICGPAFVGDVRQRQG